MRVSIVVLVVVVVVVVVLVVVVVVGVGEGVVLIDRTNTFLSLCTGNVQKRVRSKTM